jgi:ECF-type riboflavin transporter, S component
MKRRSKWLNETSTQDSGGTIKPRVQLGRPFLTSPTLDIARIGAFSALVALGTMLTNLLLGFSLPQPLGEITAAPAFYMAIAVLFSRKVGFWSTAVGSAVGEAVNIFIFGEAPAAFALTYIPGLVVARAPEALIIFRFREKSVRVLAFVMGLATVFESLILFLIDWPVYSYTAFYSSQAPCGNCGLVAGFWLAALDFGTMIDLVWIPVALVLVVAARRAYNVQFFT